MASRTRPGPARRLTAWLATGPLGHLIAGVLDWLELVVRWLWARARGRDPWL